MKPAGEAKQQSVKSLWPANKGALISFLFYECEIISLFAGQICVRVVQRLCSDLVVTGDHTSRCDARKKHVFKLCLGWCDHKWTALGTGVNAPKMHWGRIEIRSLRLHSEVVWAAYGHILLAVWTRMCAGPPAQLTSSSWTEVRKLPSSTTSEHSEKPTDIYHECLKHLGRFGLPGTRQEIDPVWLSSSSFNFRPTRHRKCILLLRLLLSGRIGTV